MTSTKSRIIVHVDMDSFFVSVERLHDPSLRGVPVVTGGSAAGRGVVSSASYEARAYGVRSAMPMAQALRLCPHLRVVSGGHGRYGEYSRQLRAIFMGFTPLVQMASLDEAYLDLGGTEKLWGPPLAAAEKLREAVLAGTNLPCSLGVASSRMVAKVASGLCKPAALLYVPHGSEESFFAPLPIRRLPGIGPRTAERLQQVGVHTLGQLASIPEPRLRAMFGDHGPELAARARGEDDSPVVPDEAPKSIGAEETLGRDTRDLGEMHALVADLCERVAFRLRQQGFTARTVTLKYRFASFETHTAARSLPEPVCDESLLMAAAFDLLEERVLRRREAVRLLGVTASNLMTGWDQEDLFDAETRERRKRLLGAVDRLRGKHGFDALRRGSSKPPPGKDPPR